MSLLLSLAAPQPTGWLNSLAPGPVFVRLALCQSLVVPPIAPLTPPPNIGWLQPLAVPVTKQIGVDTNAALTWVSQPPTVSVVTPSIGWLQPFDVPQQLLRRIDTNAGLAWTPQKSYPAPTPSSLEWLQPFAFRTAPRPFYDLNITWVPQPSFNAPPTRTLEWLQPFPVQFAPRPVWDLNSGWAVTLPPAVAPTPSILGWLQPLAIRFAPKPYYDLNSGYVPAPPPVVAVTPSTLGWLQPFNFRTAPRPFYDLNNGWVPVPPTPFAVTPSTLGWLQPFGIPPPPPRRPSFNETYVAQNVGGQAPPLHGNECLLLFEDGSGNLVLEDNTGFLALEFCERVAWLVPFDVPRPPPRLPDVNQYWVPQVPAAATITPSTLGWLQAFPVPPRETVVINTVLLPFAVPAATVTPSELGWLQPFGIPRQPVRLWDWNTAWPAAPPAPFAITPSILGWLQPFPIPPQPPRRPTFNEIYVPQNVGGTAPIPPTVLQPGGESVPHTFSRKRWRELQMLIAAEMAAVAKAERLTKPDRREALLKAARAAAAAVDAAEAEGENARLDKLLVRNAETIRRAIRAATQVKLQREIASAIEQSHAIVARRNEDEEDEMIALLLMS